MKVTLQVEVEKEVNDVVQLAADIVIALKAKKPVADIVVGELAKLEAAVAGFGALADDVKTDMSGSIKGAMLPMIDAVSALLAPAAPAA